MYNQTMAATMSSISPLCWAGLLCVFTAIVGGGLSLSGFSVPVITSSRRQVLLGIFGAILIYGSYARGGGKKEVCAYIDGTWQVKNIDSTSYPAGTVFHLSQPSQPYGCEVTGSPYSLTLSVSGHTVRGEGSGVWGTCHDVAYWNGKVTPDAKEMTITTTFARECNKPQIVILDRQ